MTGDDQGREDLTFLSRWMRRKAEHGAGHGAEEPERKTPGKVAASKQAESFTDISAPAEQSRAPLTETGESGSPDGDSPGVPQTQAPLLTDRDMPSVDTLNEASDFGQFMSPGVSDVLRKAALRKLFRLPVFGIRDGLDDYDEDFRNFAALGNIVTADMKFEKRRFEERMREEISKRRALGEDIDEETEEQLVAEAGNAALPDDAAEDEAASNDGATLKDDAYSANELDEEDFDEDGETDEEALG